MRAEIEHRPLLVALVGLCLGLTLTSHWIHLLLLIALLMVLKLATARTVCAGSALVGIGLSLLPGPKAPGEGFQRMAVTLISPCAPSSYGCSAQAVVSGAPIRLYAGEANWQPGEKIEVNGVVKARKGANGQTRSIKVSSWTSLEPPTLPQRIANGWHDSFAGFHEARLGPEQAARLQAMVFGDSARLDADYAERIQETGATQLVLVSGLQALGLIWILEAFTQLIGTPRSWMLLLVTLCLGLYALATGLRSSLIRSIVVGMAGRAAYLVRRPPDPLNIGAGVSAAFVIFQPSTVYTPGFQLGAVALLAFYLSPMVLLPTEGLWRVGADFLRRALVCFLFLAPLQALLFHEVSLGALLVLPLVIGVVPLLVALSALAHLLSSFAMPLAVGLETALVGPLLRLLDGFLSSLDALGGTFAVPDFNAYLLLPYWLAALFLGRKIAG